MALLANPFPGARSATGPRRRPRVDVAAALLGAMLLALAPAAAQAEGVIASKEYLVKAAFLFNFTQFVEWPPEAFADDEAPIRIGILGDDPFGKAIDETVRGETVRNRKLTIKRARRPDELKDCHLVFVARSEKGHSSEIIAALDKAPILTVGAHDDFADQGGIIGFYRDGQKVRFRINPSAAQRRNLKVSSQLLSLGKVVGPEVPSVVP